MMKKVILLLLILSASGNIGAQADTALIKKRLYSSILQNTLTKISYERILYLKNHPEDYKNAFNHIIDTSEAYFIWINKVDSGILTKYFLDIDLYKYSGFYDYGGIDKEGMFIKGNTPFDAYYSRIMDNGIVGLKQNGEIIYISGYLFLDNIKGFFFKENVFSKQKIEDYIQIRYYNYSPEIKKVKGRKVIFFSNEDRYNYSVKIRKSQYKNDKIKNIELGHVNGLPDSCYPNDYIPELRQNIKEHLKKKRKLKKSNLYRQLFF